MTIEHKENKRSVKIQAAREATQAGNKALLLSMLNRELLEETVDSTGNTLLLFAVQTKNLACVQLLVETGANFRVTNKNGFGASDIASVSEQLEMVAYFDRLFFLDKQLTDRIQQLIKPGVGEKPAAGGLTEYQQLQQGVYAAIGKIASAFPSEAKSLGLMEKMLLHATISGLQEAISSSQSHAALLNNLQDFFRRRETLLENTGLDYCFLPREHICHASCYEVAELLRKATGKTDIYQVLLPISKCERRPSHAEKWINALADENDLPACPGEFVRWHGEIHLWEQVLYQAVVNMADSERSLERVWRKTDNKYTQPKGEAVKPGPLPEALLSVLRQKGAACEELVTYAIERSAASVIWQKFEALYKGLVAGSVSGKGEHKGRELVAGKTGSEAVAVFFDWWNGLPQSKRQQLGSLHAHFNSGYGNEELSGDKSIEQLLQQMRNPTLSAQQNALTCLDIISKHLKVILDKNSAVFEQGAPPKTKAQLESLRDKALAELGKPLTGCVIYDSPLGMNQLLESKKIAGLNELITVKLATAIDMSNMATVQVMLLNHPDLMTRRVNTTGPTIRELLRAKANAFLIRAIVQDAFPTFKHFLTLFPDLLNAPINTEGDTLLISAAFNGRITMVRELLEHKQVAVFAQNLQGETARQCAEKGGHVEVIALLKTVEETAFPSLIDQADVDTIKHAIGTNKKLINLVSAKGQTALSVAIQQENWTLVEWLLAQGADLFLPDASSGKVNALSELVTLLFSKPERKIQAAEETRKRAVVTKVFGELMKTPRCKEVLLTLQQLGLLTPANLAALQTQAQYIDGLGQGFTSLRAVGLLTQANVTALLAQAQRVAGLGRGLASLQGAGLLTPASVTALLAPQHAAGLGRGRTSLQAAGLLTPANVTALLAQAPHAAGLGQGLVSLQAAGLLTQANFADLLVQAQHAAGLGQGLASLQAAGLFTQANFADLLVQAQHAAGLSQVLVCLQEAGLLTQANFTALLARAPYAASLGQWLASLQGAGMLTQANFTDLLAQARYVYGLGQVLVCLQEAGLLTQANFTALLAQASYAASLSGCLASLQAAGILTQANFTALLAPALFSEDVRLRLGQGLASLQEAGILTQANFTALLAQAWLYKLDQVLASLQAAGILTQANFTALLAVYNVSQVLVSLQAAGLLTQANFAALLAQARYAHGLYQGVATLQFAGLLTQANVTALLAQAQHAASLSECLSWLWVARIHTQANFTALLAQAQHADDLGRCLAGLQSAGLLTQANVTALVAQVQHAAGLGQGLVSLRLARLCTQANVTALVVQVQHAAGLGQGLVSLRGAGILTQANFTTLLTHPQHAAALACCLVSLQQAHILTPINVAALLTQANHSANLNRGLVCLRAANLLTQANFNLLLQESAKAVSVAEDLSALQAAGILTQANVDAVFGQTWHSSLTGRRGYRPGVGQGLACLQQAGLLNNENRKRLIAQAAYATHLSLALHYLRQAQILNQASFTLIVTQAQHAPELNYIFSYLQRAGLLNGENFNVLLSKSVHAENIKNQLHQLRAAGRLNQESFTIVIQQAGVTPFITPVHHSVVSSSSVIPARGSSGMLEAKQESKRWGDTEERVPQGVVASSSAFFQVSSQQAEQQHVTSFPKKN
jgi:ankyrin repeat protein